MWNQRAYRRHLPHFQNRDRTYLVTFVTHNRWVLPNVARDIALAEVVRHHEQSAFILTCVVMPEHVHVVMQPIESALSEILRLMKGRSSRAINLALQRCGSVWQQESHDYQIRTAESLVRKCDYVAMNPMRKGLCSSVDEWPWLFRWWTKRTG